MSSDVNEEEDSHEKRRLSEPSQLLKLKGKPRNKVATPAFSELSRSKQLDDKWTTISHTQIPRYYEMVSALPANPS